MVDVAEAWNGQSTVLSTSTRHSGSVFRVQGAATTYMYFRCRTTYLPKEAADVFLTECREMIRLIGRSVAKLPRGRSRTSLSLADLHPFRFFILHRYLWLIYTLLGFSVYVNTRLRKQLSSGHLVELCLRPYAAQEMKVTALEDYMSYSKCLSEHTCL